MASSDEQPQSLRAIFDAAESARQALSSHPSATAPAYSADLDAAISLHARLLDQISAASLFSLNEPIDDVPTTSLPLLLTTYHAADLVQKKPSLAAPERRDVLRRARAAYERFLDLADGYGLVKGSYARLLERYRDDEEGFAVATGSDAAARRDGKIASYKAEKELKQKLETLRNNPRYLEYGDEELVRELHLANIAFAVHSTFAALDSLNREVEILALAPSSPQPPPATQQAINPDDRHSARSNAQDSSLRLDTPLSSRPNGSSGAALLSRQGKPLQPFTLVGSRVDRARGVFRPGHNLPTMSIDEYLEEERRQGNILEGGTDPPKKVVDEDDMDAVDRETYKAREWDDYKDENLKGSGNTMNMG